MAIVFHATTSLNFTVHLTVLLPCCVSPTRCFCGALYRFLHLSLYIGRLSWRNFCVRKFSRRRRTRCSRNVSCSYETSLTPYITKWISYGVWSCIAGLVWFYPQTNPLFPQCFNAHRWVQKGRWPPKNLPKIYVAHFRFSSTPLLRVVGASPLSTCRCCNFSKCAWKTLYQFWELQTRASKNPHLCHGQSFSTPIQLLVSDLSSVSSTLTFSDEIQPVRFYLPTKPTTLCCFYSETPPFVAVCCAQCCKETNATQTSTAGPTRDKCATMHPETNLSRISKASDNKTEPNLLWGNNLRQIMRQGSYQTHRLTHVPVVLRVWLPWHLHAWGSYTWILNTDFGDTKESCSQHIDLVCIPNNTQESTVCDSLPCLTVNILILKPRRWRSDDGCRFEQLSVSRRVSGNRLTHQFNLGQSRLHSEMCSRTVHLKFWRWTHQTER